MLVTGTTWTGTRGMGKIYYDAIQKAVVLYVIGETRSGTRRRGMEYGVRTL